VAVSPHASKCLACGDTALHVVEFRHYGNRRLVRLVPVHAASALWLPACAAVLSAPSQQLDDAAYGRHTCFKQSVSTSSIYAKTKATDDGMLAACLGHAHIAWHHDTPAKLVAEPGGLEQLT